jgi:hypothetical protein
MLSSTIKSARSRDAALGSTGTGNTVTQVTQPDLRIVVSGVARNRQYWGPAPALDGDLARLSLARHPATGRQ